MLENPTHNTYENKSDLELVQLSLENKENFYYLIKRYEHKIFCYISRLTNVSQEESEDILQDIFIKVYRNLNGFNQNFKFSSWIYRIAHNEIINHYHKNKSRLEMVSLNLDNNDVYNLDKSISDTDDVYNYLISKENADKIREVLAKLPNKYREVLILHYLDEKKYDEISDILCKPPGTVATLINRAKSKFKKIAKIHNLMVNHDRYK